VQHSSSEDTQVQGQGQARGGRAPWALSPLLQPGSGLPAVHVFQTLQELLRQPMVDGIQPRKRFEWVFGTPRTGPCM